MRHETAAPSKRYATPRHPEIKPTGISVAAPCHGKRTRHPFGPTGEINGGKLQYAELRERQPSRHLRTERQEDNGPKTALAPLRATDLCRPDRWPYVQGQLLT